MKKLKGIDGKLDEAWSLLVKLRAGLKCEYCGTTKNLNSHHVYSRSKRSTRWLPENGVCLCVSHHTFNSGFSAHKTPLEFRDWLVKEKGEDFVNDLMVKANTVQKFYKADKEQMLEELRIQIEELQKEG